MANSRSGPKLPFVPSFASPVGGNAVTALVDGSAAMKAVYDALMDAKKYVYITDWRMILSIALDRDPAPRNNSRVGNVLGYLVRERGIDIRVILWKSPTHPSCLYLGDKETIQTLRDLGVKCFSHSPGSRWSHHQKIVVVDGEVAFVGGVDLTEGRWDTSKHPVLDPANHTILHEKRDYYNTTLIDCFFDSSGFRRETAPRLPWHDVHCRIYGPAAFDVTRNFAERWNNTKGSDSTARFYDDVQPLPPFLRGPGNMTVQAVRSLSSASGLPKGRPPERSIEADYILAIQSAEHFIYIENQYFISRHGKGLVENGVMNALADRIVTAIRDHADFVVVIVLPVEPEGFALSSWVTQEQMYWQFRTINRNSDHRGKPLEGVTPLVQRLAAALRSSGQPVEQVPEYLSIHSLRSWGKRKSQPPLLFTEQVYVHAKTMLVDDAIAIIGSANINDRSMLGTRDSEIAVTIVDSERLDVTMGGKPYKGARRFARDLRLRLWEEHLGLEPSEASAIADPLAAHSLWKATSKSNTDAFKEVFDFLPRDEESKLPDKATQRRRSVLSSPEREAALNVVKGHLVDFPLFWLIQEDLETTGLPDNIFTEAPTDKRPTEALA